MRSYRVFISHSWSYIDELRRLRNLLETRGYFNVEFMEVTPDYPINSQNANYIKQRLRQKIQEADVVLGIAGMYASYSDWMDWELSTAKSYNKSVIGVVPRGAQRISETVNKYSITNVNWNTESIVSAIRLYSK